MSATKPSSAGVQELIDVLPEAVAWAEGRGCPIVIPDPCTDHGRALLRTLGAYVAEFMIERIKPDMKFGKWLDEWKALKADGWDVTVLLDHGDKTVIGMASRIERA
jgi:hypothetical protein